MLKCWQDSPTQRPTFEELVQKFDAMLVSLSDKVRVRYYYTWSLSKFSLLYSISFISFSVSSGFASK